jgi:hypothetical protein
MKIRSCFVELFSSGRWRSWLSHLSNILYTEGPQFDPGSAHSFDVFSVLSTLCPFFRAWEEKRDAPRSLTSFTRDVIG